MKFRWLNFHVDYACRHSGMCCTSGWPIPVERSAVSLIEETIARKVIPLQVVPWYVPSGDAPDEVAGLLSVRENGHCVFFEAGGPGCSIHDVKPAGCVHFPYVCLIDQRGVHVNLSHYCPTAAAMLFEHDGPIAIVDGPPPVGEGEVEGLDARESLPPTFAKATADRPGEAPRLMSWGDLDAWQRDQIANAKIDEFQPDDVALFDRARAAVPAPWTWAEAPPKVESLCGRWLRQSGTSSTTR